MTRDLHQALLAVTLIVAPVLLQCGPPPSPSPSPTTNGIWLTADAGTGFIGYQSADGGERWYGKHLYFPRITAELDLDCSVVQISDGGTVTLARVGSGDDNNIVTQGADGGWNLALTLPDSFVDSQYKNAAPAAEKATIVGTVTATFAGSAALEAPDLLHVSLRLEYNDAEKLLSTDQDAFTVPRVEECR